jgi:hypothetical protein
MSRTKRILLGLGALLVAAVLWLVCLHCCFTHSAESFHTDTGLSPAARELPRHGLHFPISCIDFAGSYFAAGGRDGRGSAKIRSRPANLS